LKKQQTIISDKINKCFDLIDQAELFAYDGLYEDSNKTWSKASEIAVQLVKEHSPSMFLEDEFRFLKTIINHIKEED
jgi:hypothetical protein